jgi:hypothetical protein
VLLCRMRCQKTSTLMSVAFFNVLLIQLPNMYMNSYMSRDLAAVELSQPWFVSTAVRYNRLLSQAPIKPMEPSRSRTKPSRGITNQWSGHGLLPLPPLWNLAAMILFLALYLPLRLKTSWIMSAAMTSFLPLLCRGTGYLLAPQLQTPLSPIA